MKHLYIGFLLFIFYSGNAQQTLSFDYDESGNQKLRNIICVNCRKAVTDDIDEEIASFTESSDYSQIFFYPNPVHEELFLKWQNIEGSFVSSLEVYTMQGQMIYSKNDLSQTETASIGFNSFAQGMYVVSLNYNTGEKKDLKVIKK